jgi:hypothetical protein
MVIRPVRPFPPHANPAAAERHAARRTRVGPIGAVREANAPVRKGVEMCGKAPAGPVAHSVRAHDAHRLAGAVQYDQPEAGDGQHPFQKCEGRPPVRLRPRDRRRADAHGGGQLALAEIGDTAGSAHGPRDVQAFGHAVSLILGAAGPEASSGDLWTRTSPVDKALSGRHSRSRDYVSAPIRGAET